MKTWLFIVFLLAGCGSQTYTNSSSELPISNNVSDVYLWRINIDPNDWFYAEYEFDQSYTDGLSTSLSSANSSAAYSAPPGSSPGQTAAASLIGSLISIGIINSSQKTEQKKSASEPVSAFLEKAQDINYSELENRLWEQFKILDLDKDLIRDGDIDSHAHNNKIPLLVTPSVSLTRDYGSINVTLDVKIGKRNKASVDDEEDTPPYLYHNAFSYYIIPAFYDQVQYEQNIDNWNQLDVLALTKYIFDAMPVLAELFAEDFSKSLSSSRFISHKPIRYKNARGSFYERGNLINQSENRLTFYNLRHQIKSVPGQIVTLHH